MGKEIIGWILRSSPLWGVAVSAGIASVVSKETIRGGSHARSRLILIGYIAVLGLLTALYLLA